MPKRSTKVIDISPADHNIDIYKEFLEWYSSNLDVRSKEFGCKTMSEFAKKYDIHRTTLYNWSRSPEFLGHVTQTRQREAEERMAGVTDGWYKGCLKGDARCIELWLSYFYGWDKKQVIQKIPEFTQDDIITLISVLPQEDQEKFYDTINSIIIKARRTREESGKELDGQVLIELEGEGKQEADTGDDGKRTGDEVAKGTKKAVRSDMEGEDNSGDNEGAKGGRKK